VWLYNVAPYYIIVNLYFSRHLGSWTVCYLHLKKEFRSCVREHQRFGICFTIYKHLKQYLGCYCPHTDYASKGLSLFIRIIYHILEFQILNRYAMVTNKKCRCTISTICKSSANFKNARAPDGF